MTERELNTEDQPDDDAEARRLRCPGCGVEIDQELEPGEVCEACSAASPWSAVDGDDPVNKLVITLRDIEQAENRRLGYRPRTPLGFLAIKYALPGLAAVLGLASVVGMVWLVGPRPMQDLASTLGALAWQSMLVTLAGVVAMLLGTALLVVLRRTRLYRAWFPIGLALLAVPTGTVGTAVGGFYWLNTLSYPFKHNRMPAIPTAMTKDPQHARMARATVAVFAPDPGGSILKSGLGAGTVVSRRGDRVVILTCSHVAMPDQSPSAKRTPNPGRMLQVTLADGRQARAAVIWAAPPPVDLALLEASIPNGPDPVEVSRDADVLLPDTPVTFMAHPFRKGWLLHTGKILKRRVHNTPAGKFSLIISDLPADHGDSGSGLFDVRGKLVGVITWKFVQGGKPLGISLPSDALLRYLQLDKQ